MRLDAHVAMPARGLDAVLCVESGRTLALLGPNGSGKSSVLAALAGLVPADSGSAHLGDVVLFDGAGALAPHERPVALLGQQPLLFPHLNALDNVAFPARARGVTAADARAQARTWLALVDAAGLAQSLPARLSGGQSQRVAIARALAAEPAMMLLDEPLAALDIDAAVAVRTVLAEVLRDRTAVLATHDVADAWMLADDIAVLHDGRVVETGRTATVLGRPQHIFTARMAGRGLLRGTRTNHGLQLPDGSELRAAAGDDAAPGTTALLTVRPGAVRLVSAEDARHTSEANNVTGVVTAVEARAESLRVWAGGLITDLDLELVREHAPSRGDTVTMHVDPAGAVTYRAN